MIVKTNKIKNNKALRYYFKNFNKIINQRQNDLLTNKQTKKRWISSR